MKYNVTVKPGSSQQKVIETEAGELVVYLHARSHDGEANTVLTKMLAEYFDVAKSQIAIVQGTKSRHKLVEII